VCTELSYICPNFVETKTLDCQPVAMMLCLHFVILPRNLCRLHRSRKVGDGKWERRCAETLLITQYMVPRFHFLRLGQVTIGKQRLKWQYHFQQLSLIYPKSAHNHRICKMTQNSCHNPMHRIVTQERF